jgi:pyruvoyl-dependent arginine decarboxylase (PvlArgDC)
LESSPSGYTYERHSYFHSQGSGNIAEQGTETLKERKNKNKKHNKQTNKTTITTKPSNQATKQTKELCFLLLIDN